MKNRKKQSTTVHAEPDSIFRVEHDVVYFLDHNKQDNCWKQRLASGWRHLETLNIGGGELLFRWSREVRRHE